MKEHIIINRDRVVTVPQSLRKIGVQYDHNVNTLTFDCPRYWDDVDLSTMKIYINYKLSDKTPGSYLAKNVRVSETDENLVHFDWRITRKVTKLSGSLTCLVCAKLTNEEGIEENHWNSDIFSTLLVTGGMENEEVIEEENTDLITQLLLSIDTTNRSVYELATAMNEVKNDTDEATVGVSQLQDHVTAIAGAYAITWNEGGYISRQDGTVNAEEGSSYSDFIEVEPGSRLIITNTMTTDNEFNAFYDASETFLSSFSNATGALDVPSGAYKMRLSKYSSATIMIAADLQSEIDAAEAEIEELKSEIVKVDVRLERTEQSMPVFDGYITQQGAVSLDTTNYSFTELKNLLPNSIISFTGGVADFWCPLWGYYADGTTVELLQAGVYTNKIVAINDEKIVCVKGWGSHNAIDLKYVNGKNEINKLYKTVSHYQEDIKDGYVSPDGTLIKDSYGGNKYVQIDDVSVNDIFIYSGVCKDWAVVWGYYEDDTPIQLLKDGVYSNTKIEITDRRIKKVIAWSRPSIQLVFRYCSINELLPSKTIAIVDVNGNGDFTNINDALNYAKKNFDVSTKDFIVYIRNGVYDVSPTNTYPYCAIEKGANRISIIGESRDGVIINCNNTSELQGSAMNVGGECIIKNLTINSLKDTSYIENLPNSRRPYALHNDYGIYTNRTENDKEYYTVVENCKLYSECHSPLGAGLHHKQVQRYVACEFISNSQTGYSDGALYLHASEENDAIGMKVEIYNCTCISKDGTNALWLPNVEGSLTYKNIPVSIKRTIGVTNGEQVTNVSKATHNLQSDSALNNMESCNY